MKTNFMPSLKLVLQSEGGWVDNPLDPGGATMKGITLRTFRGYFGESRTKEDLRNISDEDIAYIYKKGYWDACSCNILAPGLDYVIFDLAVNSGSTKAIQMLQRIAKATPDGIIGPGTLKLLDTYTTEYLINKVCLERLHFMQKLTIWSTFGKGWSSRVLEVCQNGLLMRIQRQC